MVWVLGWVFPAVKMASAHQHLPKKCQAAYDYGCDSRWYYMVHIGYMQTNEFQSNVTLPGAAYQQMLPWAALHSAPGCSCLPHAELRLQTRHRVSVTDCSAHIQLQ